MERNKKQKKGHLAVIKEQYLTASLCETSFRVGLKLKQRNFYL